jgi:hypothetical protein
LTKPLERSFGRVLFESDQIYHYSNPELEPHLVRFVRIYTTMTWEEFQANIEKNRTGLGFLELEVLDPQTLQRSQLLTYPFPECNTTVFSDKNCLAKWEPGQSISSSPAYTPAHTPEVSGRSTQASAAIQKSIVSPPVQSGQVLEELRAAIQKSIVSSPVRAGSVVEEPCSAIKIPENPHVIISLWQTLTDWVLISQCLTGREWKLSHDNRLSQFVLTNGKQDKLLIFDDQSFYLSLMVSPKIFIQMLGESAVGAIISSDAMQVQAAKKLLSLLPKIVEIDDSEILLKRLLNLE